MKKTMLLISTCNAIYECSFPNSNLYSLKRSLPSCHERMVHSTKRESATSSFDINFDCRLSNGQFNECFKITQVFQRAIGRFNKLFNFRNTVKVNVTFGYTGNADNNVLASTQVSQFQQIYNDSQIDPNYLYPSALFKQYYPLNDFDQDINMQIDANFTWSFGSTQEMFYGNPYNKKSFYDLEQTFMHELSHGLGFTSSWYPWIDGFDLLLPGWPQRDSFGYIQSLSASYIYDKFLSLSNGTSMVVLGDFIRREAETYSKQANTKDINQWAYGFQFTDGGQLAKYLFTPSEPTLAWIQLKNQWFSVILYTPLEFDHGGSFTHVDAVTYEGTAEFLMRPFGLPGEALDETVPKSNYGFGNAVLGMLHTIGYLLTNE